MYITNGIWTSYRKEQKARDNKPPSQSTKRHSLLLSFIILKRHQSRNYQSCDHTALSSSLLQSKQSAAFAITSHKFCDLTKLVSQSSVLFFLGSTVHFYHHHHAAFRLFIIVYNIIVVVINIHTYIYPKQPLLTPNKQNLSIKTF